MKPRLAIIGAGISGLTLANNLQAQYNVRVFEKARGVGGRMSTRYTEPYAFDHGAQFFTARHKAFQSFIAPLISRGLIAAWEGKVITLQEGRKTTDRLWFEPHYVAVPHMNNLCKFLAADLNVTTGTEVSPLAVKARDGWHLSDKDGQALGIYDWVISTAPPVQTHRLFAAHPSYKNSLPEPRLLGCYTLMLGFNAPWRQAWMAAKVHASPIEWIAINSTKPGRNKAVTSIVAHSSNMWAEDHIDDDMGAAELFLRQEFERVSSININTADYVACHRWRYALVNAVKEFVPLVDHDSGLASTGDWYTFSRVEDAWLNAMKLADILLQK